MENKNQLTDQEMFDLFVSKAYETIEKNYKTESGKKFIKHLIIAFLPINDFGYLLSSNENQKCCITNKKGFDIDKFAELTFESIFLNAQIIIGNEEQKIEATKKRNEMIENVRNYFKVEEHENIKITRRLYYSDKSDKLISFPAIVALRDFAINQSFKNDKEIEKIMNIKYRNEINQRKQEKIEKETPQKQTTANYTIGDAFQSELEKLKNKFENQ